MEKIQNIFRHDSVDIHSVNLINAAKLLNALRDNPQLLQLMWLRFISKSRPMFIKPAGHKLWEQPIFLL